MNDINIGSTVAQILAEGLARHGVEIMFSQSLPSALLLAAEDIGIRQYSYRTENAGIAMADGYARVSHKVGIVTAQNGPAATLLVPGLAEALKASIPIVALVQDVNRNQTDRNAFQEFDHISLFASCTKWARKISEADRAEDYLDMAMAIATSGRPGPVALMLPADLLVEPVKRTLRRSQCLGEFPLDRVQADPERIAAAAEMLLNAKRPLVIVGGGVHISGAYAELMLLQEEVGLPVTTTVMGKGAVDEAHPLSLGVGGYALGKLAPMRHMRSLYEDADVILMVGTRTNQNGTDSWTLYPQNAQYIHIDIDSAEVGRNYESLRLVGDAKLTLAALGKLLVNRRKANPAVEQDIAAARAAHAKDMVSILEKDDGPIRPERLMMEVRKIMTADTIVVTDASYSTLWAACYLNSLSAGSRFITPRGLAGLGWGMPLALGGKLARPESPVICLVGDGGFAHVWSELETSNRTGTPIVLILLNNGVLGYQKDAEDVKFGRYTTACHFKPVDHAAIARACGCLGVRIENIADFLPALREALQASQTTLIEVITDPAAYPPVTFFDPLDDIRINKVAKTQN